MTDDLGDFDGGDAGSDDFRPREHDHLVEPMFGGLGAMPDALPADDPRAHGPSEGTRREDGVLRRLWRALVRLVRPSRPASGP